MVRIKHRYLLLEILYPTTPLSTTNSPKSSLYPSPADFHLPFHSPTSDLLTPQLLTRFLRDAISDLYGDYGAALVSSSLVVKYLSCPTSTAIVRVNRSGWRMLWGGITSITRLNLGRAGKESVECVIRVVRVSGTIRKSEEECIRRSKESIRRAKKLLDPQEEYIEMEDRVDMTSGIIDDDDGSGEDNDVDMA